MCACFFKRRAAFRRSLLARGPASLNQGLMQPRTSGAEPELRQVSGSPAIDADIGVCLRFGGRALRSAGCDWASHLALGASRDLSVPYRLMPVPAGNF